MYAKYFPSYCPRKKEIRADWKRVFLMEPHLAPAVENSLEIFVVCVLIGAVCVQKRKELDFFYLSFF